MSVSVLCFMANNRKYIHKNFTKTFFRYFTTRRCKSRTRDPGVKVPFTCKKHIFSVCYTRMHAPEPATPRFPYHCPKIKIMSPPSFHAKASQLHVLSGWQTSHYFPSQRLVLSKSERNHRSKDRCNLAWPRPSTNYFVRRRPERTST